MHNGFGARERPGELRLLHAFNVQPGIRGQQCRGTILRSPDHGSTRSTCGLNFRESYDVKVRAMLGAGKVDNRTIVILGRQAACCEPHMEVEADERLYKAVRRERGSSEGSTGLSAPAVREEGVESGERVEVERREASRHRGTAPRARSDVLCAI